MKLEQSQVATFMRGVNERNGREVQAIGETSAIRDAELRARLIREEADETVKAILEGDLVEAIDGLCDLLYVALGTAVSFGVDLEPFWEEVHANNMTKLAGPIVDGKLRKPEGWKPPRIRELLRELYGWEGEGR